MLRAAFSALALSGSMLALAACASPEADVAAAAAAAAPVMVAEAPAVEASIAPLASTTPMLTQVAEAEDAMTLPISYSCSAGRTFIAVFPEHGRTVTVAAGGETRVLQHRGKTDDFIFSDGEGVTLTAEGAGAALSGLGGVYADCMAG
jgi:hypothetical protein